TMYLQCYKAFVCHVIHQACCRHPIHKCADGIPDTFHPIMIPLIVFKSILCVRVKGEGIEPAASCFIINTAAPCSVRLVDFYLIAMNATIVVVRGTFTAYLNT